jgi:hypothetical protein
MPSAVEPPEGHLDPTTDLDLVGIGVGELDRSRPPSSKSTTANTGRLGEYASLSRQRGDGALTSAMGPASSSVRRRRTTPTAA